MGDPTYSNVRMESTQRPSLTLSNTHVSFMDKQPVYIFNWHYALVCPHTNARTHTHTPVFPAAQCQRTFSEGVCVVLNRVADASLNTAERIDHLPLCGAGVTPHTHLPTHPPTHPHTWRDMKVSASICFYITESVPLKTSSTFLDVIIKVVLAVSSIALHRVHHQP